MKRTTAKVFTTGRSQAVRLPKNFRFEEEEVYVRKEGNNVILSPRPE
ncbi:MAG: antitoxin, partial [Sulfuricaulis sp.]